MLKNKKSSQWLLSSPYITWAIIFIVVPLCMVFYYGLNDKSGTFNAVNVVAMM